MHVMELILPVLGGTPDPRSGEIDVADVFGTAFAIGQGVYLTAGHVIEAAREKPVVALAYPEDQGKSWGLIPIDQHEIVADYDVAAMRSRVPWGVPLPWHEPLLQVLSDVAAFGYPYGLDHETRMVRPRGFKGHTVIARTFERLRPQPAAYELSFQAPRGLSGAPLLSGDTTKLLSGEDVTSIVGMIIGNSSSQMLVFRHQEREAEGGREKLYEHFEAMSLGVAIAARSLLDVEFEMLGGSLRTFLGSLASSNQER